MMNYPVIPLSKLRIVLQQASEDAGQLPADVEDYVSFRGEGQTVVAVLSLLKGELDTLGLSHGFDSKFDAKARPIIHGYLSNLDDQVLIDDDFWRYLSGVFLYQIVRSRHPESAKAKSVEANWANFGGKNSSTTESLIRRLYLGASLSIDSTDRQDTYHLSRIHDVDLWQSHIIRVLSGENPVYVRSLLKWFKHREKWYSNMPNSIDVMKDLNKLENFRTAHLRDFVKRIRRLRSNVIHEFLDENEISAMISRLAQESIDDRKSWGKSSQGKTKRKKSPSKRVQPKPAKKLATSPSRARKKLAAKKKSASRKNR